MTYRKLLVVFSVTIVLTLAASLHPAHAQDLPDYVVKSVAEVVAYADTPFIDDNRIKQGSGVFVDNGGCMYTNTHVALDLEADQPEPHLAVYITQDRDQPPVFAFEAKVIYADQALDLAYICPVQDNGIFTYFFQRQKTEVYDTLPFGKPVWVMGYPGAGEKTITLSPGHVIGFITNPDVSDWVGTPALDPEKLALYKTDALAGPGISGGLMVDENFKLLGVPFAGSLIPGAFTFILSDKVYLEFERELRLYQHAQGLVPADCVYDPDSDYYYQAGVKFYDEQCTMPFDGDMEYEVKSTYQAFCSKPIPQDWLVPAIRRSKELGDLSKWSDNLEALCPQQQEQSTTSQSASLQPGDYAYGMAQLSGEQENQMTQTLKNDVQKELPDAQISASNWQTLANAYVYGGYTEQSIVRAVELGGYTVHPSIPFSSWQHSQDYITHI